MEDMRKEVIENMEQDTSYDFIANNYWKLSKEELKDICLELTYAIHRHEQFGDDVKETAIDGLKERWEEE